MAEGVQEQQANKQVPPPPLFLSMANQKSTSQSQTHSQISSTAGLDIDIDELIDDINSENDIDDSEEDNEINNNNHHVSQSKMNISISRIHGSQVGINASYNPSNSKNIHNMSNKNKNDSSIHNASRPIQPSSLLPQKDKQSHLSNPSQSSYDNLPNLPPPTPKQHQPQPAYHPQQINSSFIPPPPGGSNFSDKQNGDQIQNVNYSYNMHSGMQQLHQPGQLQPGMTGMGVHVQVAAPPPPANDRNHSDVNDHAPAASNTRSALIKPDANPYENRSRGSRSVQNNTVVISNNSNVNYNEVANTPNTTNTASSGGVRHTPVHKQAVSLENMDAFVANIVQQKQSEVELQSPQPHHHPQSLQGRQSAQSVQSGQSLPIPPPTMSQVAQQQGLQHSHSNHQQHHQQQPSLPWQKSVPSHPTYKANVNNHHHRRSSSMRTVIVHDSNSATDEKYQEQVPLMKQQPTLQNNIQPHHQQQQSQPVRLGQSISVAPNNHQTHTQTQIQTQPLHSHPTLDQQIQPMQPMQPLPQLQKSASQHENAGFLDVASPVTIIPKSSNVRTICLAILLLLSIGCGAAGVLCIQYGIAEIRFDDDSGEEEYGWYGITDIDDKAKKWNQIDDDERNIDFDDLEDAGC